MARFYLAAAAAFAILAGVAGYHAWTLPWAPRIDWDVLGILFFFENAPRLGAFIMLVFFGTLSLRCWVRSQHV